MLASPNRAAASLDGLGLDALVAAAVRMRPDTLYLRDPARIESWAGRAGTSFSASEIDARARRLAALLSLSRLPERAHALILAPMGAEQLIATLGALRAGLRPFLLPLTMGPNELQACLDAAGPSVAIGTTRCGDLAPARLLRDAAARAFNARLVCAFGPEPPDGAVPLDSITTSDVTLPPPAPVTSPPEALSFSIETSYGQRQQASELDLMTATVDIARVASLGAHARVLSLMMCPSVLALATGPYLTLLSGAEYLPLGHFSLSALWAGLSDGKPTTVVAPAETEGALAAAGIVGHGAVANLFLLHRSRPAPSPANDSGTRVIDLFADADNRFTIQLRR
jgi:acyl-CoA synthetase (AMP-forming)/AMP-acid ligase II